MIDDEELEKLRKELNDAQAEFRLKPTAATKAAYASAGSAYRKAKAKAKLPPGPVHVATQEEHPAVAEARERSNEAFRAMYADPGASSREAWLAAKNEYQKLKRKHDPVYRAKAAEASRKSREKAKLGLTGKPDS